MKISLIYPQKLVLLMKKKKSFKGIHQKLVSEVGVMVSPLTEISATEDLCCNIEDVIVSKPNQEAPHAGIDI